MNQQQISNKLTQTTAIVNDLRPVAKEEGRNEAKDAVYQWFVDRCRDNLHISLVVSPVVMIILLTDRLVIYNSPFFNTDLSTCDFVLVLLEATISSIGRFFSDDVEESRVLSIYN